MGEPLVGEFVLTYFEAFDLLLLGRGAHNLDDLFIAEVEPADVEGVR
jgi:hypothetical protein